MKTEETSTQKLTELANRIRDWQLSQNLSDTELCTKRFPGLGSTKTYKRILAGDLQELDLERWTLEYEQVWTLMGMEVKQDGPAYDDLWHMRASRTAVTEAMQETGNNRLVIIEGPSGSGKTTAARNLAEKFGRRVVLSEADETWKGPKLGSMLGGLLHSLEVREIPVSEELRLKKLLLTLQQSPVCLVVDEAHHLGLRTLNLVKTILNQTKCQVVLCAVETLFKRLESSAYEEAKQLTRNRLCERVRLNGPKIDDVQKFLTRRTKWADQAQLEHCSKALAEWAKNRGGWNFVNQVARRCTQLAGKDPVDKETYAEAVRLVDRTR